MYRRELGLGVHLVNGSRLESRIYLTVVDRVLHFLELPTEYIFFNLDRPLGKLIEVYVSAKRNPVHFFLP